jgi:hypothetical protein
LGLSATVGEQIEALRRVAGEQAVQLIRREPDESIMRIVETWARALEATRAVRLGLAAESSFDEIIGYTSTMSWAAPSGPGRDRIRSHRAFTCGSVWSSLRYCGVS